MIFVTLGTQDKEFTRLLEAIDREIKKKNINGTSSISEARHALELILAKTSLISENLTQKCGLCYRAPQQVSK